MQTVVITGSARGFGLELARVFKKNNFNVVLSDINETNLKVAEQTINDISGSGKAISVLADVSNHDALVNLWDTAKQTFGDVDIWINNAGVNQPDKPVCELEPEEIEFLLNIDVKGTIFGSKIAFLGMKEQGFGQIYNVEGYGSNDATMMGLSIYGTSKRAVTYFTKALAKESEILTNNWVCICTLTPGIKKVYNILGDYPNTIAEYCVPRMIKNKKNGYQVVWLSNRRAFGRFLTAGFKKRDFFSEK